MHARLLQAAHGGRVHVIPDTLHNLLSQGKFLGSFSATSLMAEVALENVTGVAFSQRGSSSLYLIFLNGAPAGAVYTDENGPLYGDTAVLKITSGEEFHLSAVGKDLLTPLIAACRIHDATHLTRPLSTRIPEIGRRSATAGILTILVVRKGIPSPGMHVSVRRGKQIIGSSVSSADGTAVFKIFPGEYECAVMDSSLRIVTKPVRFSDDSPNNITIETGG